MKFNNNKTHNGCLVTNDSKQFANFIQQLLTDEVFYNKISSEATTFFDDNHNIEKNSQTFDKIFQL